LLEQSLRKWGLALATVAVVASWGTVPTSAEGRPPPPTSTVSLSTLPAEAQVTERLIRAGGPFPFTKDGSVFGNRERQLPTRARGFYREYTVPTPGLRHRGARRIVCGGPPPRHLEVCYYTEDHYASFRRIAE
jgi:ribonuclease T1